MNAKEIDEVLDAYYYYRYDVLAKYADFEGNSENTRDLYTKDGNFQIIKRRIMDKIEKGDFEHFLSRMSEKRGDYDVHQCVELLCCSSNVELIKSIVNRSKEMNIGFRVVQLIEATKDVNYMKEIIEDKERWKDLGITDNGIAYLIRHTNDKEYITEKVHNIEELGIKGHSIVNLMKGLHEPKVIANLLERTSTFQLEGSDLISMFSSENMDFETKIEVLENACKNRYWIIISMTDESDQLKAIIEDGEKRRKLHLGMDEIVSLLDVAYQSDEMKEIVKSKEKRDELQLSSNEMLACLIRLDDSEYLNDILNKKEECEFDDDFILKLLLFSKNERMLDDFLDKQEEYNADFELGDYDIIAVLYSVDEPKFIKKILDKKEKMRLDDDTISTLTLMTKDEKMIEDFFERREEHNEKDTDTLIKLPKNMTIGMEIESEGDRCQCIEYAEKLNGWNCKGDSSLYRRC
ncbi:MAG: hypothetical protein IKD76_06185 [Clostridia bacterium]|nr:hypothetical protein [Clostridia bacterium]